MAVQFRMHAGSGHLKTIADGEQQLLLVRHILGVERASASSEAGDALTSFHDVTNLLQKLRAEPVEIVQVLSLRGDSKTCSES